jgi:predicted metalloprotease
VVVVVVIVVVVVVVVAVVHTDPQDLADIQPSQPKLQHPQGSGSSRTVGRQANKEVADSTKARVTLKLLILELHILLH